MLCQHCKKNTATYNRVEDINGELFETHLCKSCYIKLFGGLNSLNTVGDINALLFGSPVKRRKACPVCGTTYNDYERTGLLGCASCYDVFKEELLPAIDRIHGKPVMSAGSAPTTTTTVFTADLKPCRSSSRLRYATSSMPRRADSTSA